MSDSYFMKISYSLNDIFKKISFLIKQTGFFLDMLEERSFVGKFENQDIAGVFLLAITFITREGNVFLVF